MTRRELYNRIFEAAQSVYSELEAGAVSSLLCEAVFGFDRLALLTEPERECEAANMLTVDRVCREVAAARPVQYIIGYTEVCNLRFVVAEGVLIPRPETEQIIRRIVSDNAKRDNLRILDIGTGSGVIAVCLAASLSHPEVMAVDISQQALDTASRNVALNQVAVRLYQCDILTQTPSGTFDIVVSNPPYVTQSEKPLMQNNVLAYEPHSALFVEDNDPLLFYRVIAEKATQWLSQGGILYFEINEKFGPQILALLRDMGYVDIEIVTDLFDRDRMAKAVFKPL